MFFLRWLICMNNILSSPQTLGTWEMSSNRLFLQNSTKEVIENIPYCITICNVYFPILYIYMQYFIFFHDYMSIFHSEHYCQAKRPCLMVEKFLGSLDLQRPLHRPTCRTWPQIVLCLTPQETVGRDRVVSYEATYIFVPLMNFQKFYSTWVSWKF